MLQQASYPLFQQAYRYLIEKELDLHRTQAASIPEKLKEAVIFIHGEDYRQREDLRKQTQPPTGHPSHAHY